MAINTASDTLTLSSDSSLVSSRDIIFRQAAKISSFKLKVLELLEGQKSAIQRRIRAATDIQCTLGDLLQLQKAAQQKEVKYFTRVSMNCS